MLQKTIIKIELSDFKLVMLEGKPPFHHYHSLKIGDIEICIEPCLDGFDVGLYKNEILIYPKREAHTNIFVLRKLYAVKKANELYHKWEINNGK